MLRRLGSKSVNSNTDNPKRRHPLFDRFHVRRWPLAALGLLVFAVLSMIANKAPSQIQSTETSTVPEQELKPAPDPPGTIDGAKTPELIPDDVAYQLVFLGLAEPESATDEQKARFSAKVASAGLDELDKEALLQLLGSFQKQNDALNAEID